MEVRDPGPSAAAGRWDLLAEELSRLRLRSGAPSYERVAQLVAERRLASGASPHAARVARSTVYDCFRRGRSRVNLALVREIALALGSTDEAVDTWVTRSHEQAAPPAEPAAPVVLPVDLTDGAGPSDPTATSPPRARSQVALLLLGCLALNLVGRFLVDALTLPIYLDMAGTAIAAMALGAVRGAAVGAATNAIGVLSSGWVSLAFLPVNVVGALVWGLGVRRFEMGRTLQRFFLLNVAAAVACSLVAVPILYVGFGGANGNGTDVITQTVSALTGVDLLGVTTSNLLASLADKLVSGFVALVALASLPAALRSGARLDLVPPPADRRD